MTWLLWYLVCCYVLVGVAFLCTDPAPLRPVEVFCIWLTASACVPPMYVAVIVLMTGDWIVARFKPKGGRSRW